MRRLFLISLVFFLLTTITKSQTLSPRELIEIKNTRNTNNITIKLRTKGYNASDGENQNNEKVSYWDFQNKPGKHTDFSIMRTEDNSGKVEIRYYISNMYNYTQLINNLAREKYRFKGNNIISGKSYTVLTRKNIFFMIAEKLNENKEETYFEVIIQG